MLQEDCPFFFSFLLLKVSHIAQADLKLTILASFYISLAQARIIWEKEFFSFFFFSFYYFF